MANNIKEPSGVLCDVTVTYVDGTVGFFPKARYYTLLKDRIFSVVEGEKTTMVMMENVKKIEMKKAE